MMSDNSIDDTSIDLGTVTSIVTSLQRIVADFYGPQCTQTLLTSQTGKAVLTSDGLCILDALQPSHPVAQIILKALKRCHSVTQDGSKAFLLYLAYFLQHLQEEINRGCFCCDGTNLKSNKLAIERFGVLCARKYVRELKQLVVPKIFSQMKLHVEKLVDSMEQKMNKTDVIRCVLKTVLMPHYNSRFCEHFADILISCLTVSSWHSSLVQTVQYLVDNFFTLTIKVPNQPYTGSTAANLFLLNRKFTLKCDNLLSLGQVSVLTIKGNINGCNTDDEPQETYIVRQAGQVADLLQHRRKMVESFANKLTDKHIDLIVCSEGIPGYASDVFRRHNISVIANITNEDLELLELLTQKSSLNDINDGIEDANIIQLSGTDELVIGGKLYIQLKLTNVMYPLKHLIVCAPTVGLCDQLAIALQKALNALKMCFIQGDCHETKICGENVVADIARDTDATGKDNEEERENALRVTSDVKDQDMLTLDLPLDGKHATETPSFLEQDIVIVDQLSEEKELDKKDQSFEDDFIERIPTFKDLVMVESSVTSFSTAIQYSNSLGLCENIKFRTIEGGGSFEVLLVRLLQDFYKSCSDPNLALICKVLERAMISVIQKLFENTTMQPENKRKFMHVKNELDDKISGGQLWGLNRRGMPCDLSEKGVVEPLSSKIHILHCVLDLVDQVLGIDKIVSVRKLEQ